MRAGPKGAAPPVTKVTKVKYFKWVLGYFPNQPPYTTIQPKKRKKVLKESNKLNIIQTTSCSTNPKLNFFSNLSLNGWT